MIAVGLSGLELWAVRLVGPVRDCRWRPRSDHGLPGTGSGFRQPILNPLIEMEPFWNPSYVKRRPSPSSWSAMA